ncbi:F-box only protein 13-like [Tasmannia lanceolata]|uniref:F-box only protein 13-like n=1 Tax=Tasmannia lanceolata TaxID=3420 RepID=UPI004062E49C
METGLSAACQKFHTSVKDGGLRRCKRIANANSKQVESDEAPWGELDDSVTERVLSKLPVADFFRFRSVCKGWNSLAESPSFLIACSEVADRQPWFYMLEAKSPAGVVYDMQVNRWRHINLLPPANRSGEHSFPVAASGGLMCFRASTGQLIVCNLISESARILPILKMDHPVLAIAMHTTGSSYKLLVTYGKQPHFGIQVFSSVENCWTDVPVTKTLVLTKEGQPPRVGGEDEEPEPNPYMLQRRGVMERRRGVVRRTGIIHRNPAKELSGVATVCRIGHEMIHFLDINGRVVACDTRQGIMSTYPHILPPDIEYSVDLVECGGRVLLVVLLEMMESASLRVWEFNSDEIEWRQLMAMPPAMSQSFYGKKADINCVGYGHLIMICISSHRVHRVVMCNLIKGTWEELPKYLDPANLRVKKFISAYCFQPRIEASV